MERDRGRCMAGPGVHEATGKPRQTNTPLRRQQGKPFADCDSMNLLALVLLTLFVQTSSAPIADASLRGSIVRLGTVDALPKAKVQLRMIESANEQPFSTTTVEDG